MRERNYVFVYMYEEICMHIRTYVCVCVCMFVSMEGRRLLNVCVNSIDAIADICICIYW